MSESRRKRVSTACRNKYGQLLKQAINPSQSVQILVSNRYNTLLCYIPKAACSNWKRVFLVLNGHYNTTDEIERIVAHRTPLLDTLDKYPKEEITHKLKTYKKIAFVRDPLQRIISAYRNKFEYDYQKQFHHRFGINIIKKYRKNLTREITDEDYITFNEFVKYLLDLGPKGSRDVHWREQVDLCSLCSTNYDFIGKFETLESDADRVLGIMGAKGVISFPKLEKRPKGLETKLLMKKFYSQISEQEFKRLVKMYEMDFELLEYSTPSYSEVTGKSANGFK